MTLMKRFLACLMAFLMPVFALAEPQTPYEQGKSVRYRLLTEEQQSLVDLLYEAAVAHEEEVTVPEGTKYDDLSVAHFFLTEDYPELIGLGKNASIYYYLKKPDEAISITLEYTMSLEEETAQKAALLEAAQQIADSAPDRGKFRQELFFHDTLCDLVTYDSSTYGNSTAAVALLEGRAVCEGYTRAMMLLCRMAGIPCSFVRGTNKENGESHAWNVLLLDGTACYTDVTWDDGDGTPTVHWYFNLSAEQMQQTHTMETEIQLPSDDGWEYHHVLGLVVDENQSVTDVLKKELSEGLEWSMMFASQADYESFWASSPIDVLNEARREVGMRELESVYYLKHDTTFCGILYE